METTLGIDLASQPKNTGLCVIEWSPGGARVSVLVRGTWNGTALHDKLLLNSIIGMWGMDSGDWGESGAPVMTAIDAPFGWPDPFVDALVLHRDGKRWPATIDDDRARFVRRETDYFVGRHAKLPLAVSADRIAYPAMRCAALLGELSRFRDAEQLARDGSGVVCEAYPDAALRRWLPAQWEGASPDSYKGQKPPARDRRELLLTHLLEGLGPGFSITEEQREACLVSDDILDALVCALLARAVGEHLTIRPEEGAQRDLACREGWIHLPEDGSLQQLL